MGDVVKFTNSTMLNTDGTLNKEGQEEALQHLDKCVKLMQKRIADGEVDGALTLLFKDGELVEDIMAGNIRSTSLVFVLEYIKYQILSGADGFTEEVTEDD
jgi:hypothetical protein|tara:strand:+ start:2592 stop:2894 length:303 start_codon:yes stop_codon:yes gene_type:complete